MTTVVGVNAHYSSRLCDCGCAADDLVLDLNHELGLPPVPHLRIPKGSGQKVAQLVQVAIEEAQAYEHGGAPQPQTLAR